MYLILNIKNLSPVLGPTLTKNLGLSAIIAIKPATTNDINCSLMQKSSICEWFSIALTIATDLH